MNPPHIVCAISGEHIKENQAIQVGLLDPDLQAFIQEQYPKAKEDSYIGLDQLLKMQQEHVKHMLFEEAGELDELQKDVLDSITGNRLMSEDIKMESVEKATHGEKIADAVAAFGGSWTFIICFFALLVIWMGLNIVFLSNKGFDPYPFILLNLILSSLAAIQAPVIMMSQNRQETKDRIRGENDYKINLKAELEIKLLNKKIDHILAHQNRRLLDIQQVQIEMLENLLSMYPNPPKDSGKKDSAKKGPAKGEKE